MSPKKAQQIAALNKRIEDLKGMHESVIQHGIMIRFPVGLPKSVGSKGASHIAALLDAEIERCESELSDL